MNANPVVTNKAYARIVFFAIAALHGARMLTAYRRVAKYAYPRLRGHFGYGDRKEHARDIALQALSDAASKVGRSAEFRTDW